MHFWYCSSFWSVLLILVAVLLACGDCVCATPFIDNVLVRKRGSSVQPSRPQQSTSLEKATRVSGGVATLPLRTNEPKPAKPAKIGHTATHPKLARSSAAPEQPRASGRSIQLAFPTISAPPKATASAGQVNISPVSTIQSGGRQFSINPFLISAPVLNVASPTAISVVTQGPGLVQPVEVPDGLSSPKGDISGPLPSEETGARDRSLPGKLTIITARPEVTSAGQIDAPSVPVITRSPQPQRSINPFDVHPGGDLHVPNPSATPVASQAVPPPAELPDSPSLPVLPDDDPLPVSPITMAPPKTTLAVQAGASSASANAGDMPLHITINPFDIAPGGGIVRHPSTATPIASQGATGVQAVPPPAELPDSPSLPVLPDDDPLPVSPITMAPPKTTLVVQAGASSASANAGDMPLHITINPFDIAPGGGIVRHPSTATPIASQGATGVQAVPPPAELPDSPSLPVLPDHSLPASPITLAPPKTTLAVQADASSASANAGKLPLHITINPFDIAPGGGIVWPPSTATPIASQGATGVQAVLPPAELPDSPNGDFPKVPEPTPTQLEPSLFPLGAPATTLATPVLAAQPVAGANDLSLAAPIPGATPGSVSPILSELLGGQVPGLNAEGVPVSASAATPPHLIVNSGAILAAPVVVNVQSAADGSDAGSGASGTLGSTTGAKGSGTGRGSSSGSFAGSGSSGGSGSGTVSSGSRNGSNGSGSNVAIGGGDSGSSHTTAKAAISGVLVAGCVAVAIVGGVMYKRRVNAVAPAGKGSKMDFEKPKRFTGSTPPPLSPLDNVSVSSEVFAPSSKDSLPAKHPATFSSAKVAAPSSPVTAARHFLAKITGKNNQKEICLPSILFNRFLPLASLALPPTDPSAKPDQDIKGAKDFLMHVRSESLTSTTLSDILSSDGSTVAPTTDDDRSSVGDETRSSSSMSEASSLGRLLDGSFGNRSSVASSLGTTVSTPRIPRPAHLYSQRRATATPTYFRSPLSETYDARSSCAPTEMMTVDRRTSDASGSTLVETEGDSVASDSLGRYI